MTNSHIQKRIQILEDASRAQLNEAGETPADVLRARIRRLATATAENESLPADERARARKELDQIDMPSCGCLTDDRGRQRCVAEVLRGGVGA